MDIGQLLGSYAFPIVMCLLMYKQQNEISERHQEETAELRDALDNNTLVIQRLIDKMEEENG